MSMILSAFEILLLAIIYSSTSETKFSLKNNSDNSKVSHLHVQ